jgi:ribosomal protein S27AE
VKKMTGSQSNPIPCPECGTPMNHHADKLVYVSESKLQEVIEEFHRCPACGAGASRRESLSSR